MARNLLANTQTEPEEQRRPRNLLAKPETQAEQKPANFDQAGAPEDKGNDRVQFGANLVRALNNGILLGFGDEIEAAINSVPQALTQNKSLSQAFDENLNAIRGSRSEFAAENPNISLVTETAGGLATGGIGSARSVAASQGGKLLERTAAAALPAAGTGFVVGAGSEDPSTDLSISDSINQRLQGGQEGAVVGAALGVGIPAAVSAARAGKELVGAARDAQKGITGLTSTALKKAGLSTDDVATLELQRRITQDGASPTRIRRNKAVLGEEASLLDTSGENLLSLAEKLAQRPGVAKNKAKKFLVGRLQGQRARMSDFVKSKISTQSDNLDEASEEIVSRMKEQAAPIYEKALSSPVKNNKVISETLKNPKIKPLLSKAAKNAQADPSLSENLKTAVRNFDIDAVPDSSGLKLSGGRGPNLVVLDYVKREIDDKISTAIRAGKNNDARIFTGIKNKLVSELDRQVPTYKKARGIWETGSKHLDALEEGQNIFKESAKNASGIKNRFKKMSPLEQEFFKLGAGHETLRKINTASDTLEGRPGSSLLKSIFGSPDKRQALQSIMNPKEFRAFRRAVQAENKFTNNANKILSGSQTAARQAENSGLVDALVDAYQISRGQAGGLASASKRMIGLDDEQVNKKLAEKLFTKDSKAIQRTILDIANKNQDLNPALLEAANMPLGRFKRWLTTSKNRELLSSLFSTGLSIEEEFRKSAEKIDSLPGEKL